MLEDCFLTDLTGPTVDVHVPLGVDVEKYLKKWSVRAAEALLPRAHRVFCRHRWCTGQHENDDPVHTQDGLYPH